MIGTLPLPATPEGPVGIADGGLVFTDIRANRIAPSGLIRHPMTAPCQYDTIDIR